MIRTGEHLLQLGREITGIQNREKQEDSEDFPRIPKLPF
jgi:hypothetical protein